VSPFPSSSPAATMIVPDPLLNVAALPRLADTLPGPGGDGARLAAPLDRFLDPFAADTLDDCLGITLNWRAAARRRLRDDALRQAAAVARARPRALADGKCFRASQGRSDWAGPPPISGASGPGASQILKRLLGWR
jgi:hypothetical protein